MDKILALREKHLGSTPSIDELKELYRAATTHHNKISREESEQLKEELQKQENLKAKIALQREQLAVEEQKCNSIKTELSNHQKLLKELSEERSKLRVENDEIESKRNHLKMLKPSATDQKILEHGRKKLDYYKLLTGIRWDYPMLKSSTKGFITNKQGYLKPFCLDLDDAETEEKIWKEVEKAMSQLKITQSDAKENSVPNH